MVRSYLNGRFENTAFCILAPDGKTRLSRTGRSPAMGFGFGGPRGDLEVQKAGVLAAMKKIAKKYPAADEKGSPVVQDFHSFRQALNVASGDQRLLVFAAAPEKEVEKIRKALASVLGDPQMIGTFHVDFGDKKEDAKWAEAVEGEKGNSGIFVIQSDAFGQKGKVVAQLPLDADSEKIKSTLVEANKVFSGTEKRKSYSEHVKEGRRGGVYFKGGVPYGEDRDGDGKVDHGGPGPAGDSRRGAGRGGRRPEPGSGLGRGRGSRGPGRGGPPKGGPPQNGGSSKEGASDGGPLPQDR